MPPSDESTHDGTSYAGYDLLPDGPGGPKTIGALVDRLVELVGSNEAFELAFAETAAVAKALPNVWVERFLPKQRSLEELILSEGLKLASSISDEGVRRHHILYGMLKRKQKLG